MGLGRLLKPQRAAQSGRKLYVASVAQAREPALYTQLGAPDTVEGRFELYSLHVVLLLHRLKGEGAAAAGVAQVLFDDYLQGLDDALRELGVGDLSVGKRMRKLGEAFYGRAKSYDAALEALPDTVALRDLIARTVLAESDAPPEPLLGYAVRAAALLATQPLEDLLDGRAQWPQAQP